MKQILRKLAAKVSMDFYEHILTYSVLNNAFTKLSSARLVKERKDLWDLAINRFIYSKSQVLYIEFGVWQGESIKYFASKNSHSDSLFLGLDSFEGLPEDWGPMPKGSFNTKGQIPIVEDNRIHFVKGWFQDSWSEALSLINTRQKSDLFVHYDADLYSSTLFALIKIDSLNKNYYAIFDEFTGDETRALYNYCKAYGATVDFFGKTITSGYPEQVLCKISPRSM